MDTTDREPWNAMSPQRWLSVLLGVGVIVYTLTRSLKTLLGFALGGWLVYRGVTGKSMLTDRLKGLQEHAQHMGMRGTRGARGMRMPEAGMEAEGTPHEVSRTVTITRPASEVYAFWRDVEGVAPHLANVQSARAMDHGRSLWTLRMPGPRSSTMEWQAELTQERENELLRWGSVPGTSPEMTVSVELAEAAGDKGTETTMAFAYPPSLKISGTPAGALMHRMLSQQIDRDLRRIKSVLEAGEAPTVASQPTGRGAKDEASDVTPLRQLVVDSIRRVTL